VANLGIVVFIGLTFSQISDYDRRNPVYAEYMPWLEQSEEIIVMLKALGLSKAQISRVLSGDVAKVEGENSSFKRISV